MAAFNSMTYRMLKLPLMQKAGDKERIFKQVAVENCYQAKTIYKQRKERIILSALFNISR